MSSTSMLTEAELRHAVEAVPDPEMPVLTLGDLGVIRDVVLRPGEQRPRVLVRLTPTYVGCPALGAIKDDVRRAVTDLGAEAEVEVVLSPRWHPGLITERGRSRLARAGIAPPGPGAGAVDLGMPSATVAPACPRCGSPTTRLVSGRGPTPCTSMHVCGACGEPFEKVRDL